MLFPSEVFLFVFLPVVLGIYYLFIPKNEASEKYISPSCELFLLCLGRTGACMAHGGRDSGQLVFRNPGGQGKKSKNPCKNSNGGYGTDECKCPWLVQVQ